MVLALLIVIFQLSLAIAITGFLIQSAWRPLAKQFNAMPFLEQHYRKNFQSFHFGNYSLGRSVHVVIDDDHLHLLPALILRCFQCRAISIPWQAMKLTTKQPLMKSFRTVQIGGIKVLGPAWCFELVSPSYKESLK
jgi:hypothetical protein